MTTALAPPAPAAGEALVIAEPASVTEALVRGELHQQVMLAKQFPRDIPGAIAEIEGAATLTPQVAEKCCYSLQQGGEAITGPSIRFAEIVQGSWGNLRTAARTIEIGERRVTVQGICHDLQRGNVVMVEVNRGIWSMSHRWDQHQGDWVCARCGETRSGGRKPDYRGCTVGARYAEHMIDKTLGAAHSIARRNAILAVVPRALTMPILEKCQTTAAGSTVPLEKRRDNALAYIERQGIDRGRVFAALRVTGIEAIGIKEVTFLRGVVEAVKEGETTFDEQFPVVDTSPRRKQQQPPAATPTPAAAATNGAPAAATAAPAAATPAAEAAPAGPAAGGAAPAPGGPAAAAATTDGIEAAAAQPTAAPSTAAPAAEAAPAPVPADPNGPSIDEKKDWLGDALDPVEGVPQATEAVALISRAQRGQLKIAATNAGKNLAEVLQRIGVSNVKDVPVTHFDQLMEALK